MPPFIDVDLGQNVADGSSKTLSSSCPTRHIIDHCQQPPLPHRMGWRRESIARSRPPPFRWIARGAIYPLGRRRSP